MVHDLRKHHEAGSVPIIVCIPWQRRNDKCLRWPQHNSDEKALREWWSSWNGVARDVLIHLEVESKDSQTWRDSQILRCLKKLL